MKLSWLGREIDVIHPVLRHIPSPDVFDLQKFVPPTAAYSFLAESRVGSSDGPGEDSFDVIVCSPEWLRDQPGPILGLHHIILPTYDYSSLVQFVEAYLSICGGADWQEVASKVGRLGHWEFEDYRP